MLKKKKLKLAACKIYNTYRIWKIYLKKKKGQKNITSMGAFEDRTTNLKKFQGNRKRERESVRLGGRGGRER